MSSDEELAEAFRSGDDGAFSTLYERHRRSLFVFGARMLGSAEAAGDLVQDTFLGIYERRRELPGLQSFRGWLFTVGRNRCLTLLRQQKTRGRLIDGAAPAPLPDGPATALENEEESRLVRRALAAMPPGAPGGPGPARVPGAFVPRDRGNHRGDRERGEVQAVPGQAVARRPAETRVDRRRRVMSCEAHRQHLSLMMDAETEDAVPAGLFGHLEGCAECRHFLDALIRFRGAARRDREEILRLADESLPARFPLPGRPGARQTPRTGRTAWWRPGLPAPAAVALAVLLLAAGVAIGTGLGVRIGRAPRGAPDAEVAKQPPGGTTYVYVCSMPQVDVIGSPIPASGQ